jgi:YjbE family integral membrane protein
VVAAAPGAVRGAGAGAAGHVTPVATVDWLGDPQFWGRVLRIIWIDLLLAGDNAVVIALAVRSLPPRQQWWGRVWGTAGAVGLRLGFLFIVTFLLGIPLLKFAGGLILVWIAVKLLKPQEESGPGHVREGTSLLEAIWIIMVADVTMSLDNVLAVAGAAGGNFMLVVFGIMVSLPLVVFGSGIIGWLMSRWIWIVWLGGGVLGWVAGEMMTTDVWVVAWLGRAAPVLHYPVMVGLAAGLTGLGWWLSRRERRLREKLEKMG